MSDLDVVVFGATGYVGALVAEHLARTAPAAARIGLAGRSEEKLRRVQERLGVDWPLLVVDAAAPQQLVDSARVVCTTVGPYARYGGPLAEACARTGTAYLDLTGEVLFHRRLVETLDDVARGTGARLVPSCGWDSIPSDLGVQLLATQAGADGEGTLTGTTMVASFRGRFSGGTVDSLRNQVDQVAQDPSLAAVVADPYALSPDRAAEPADAPPDRPGVGRTGDGRWTGPFAMAQYNTRVVRRSNALQDWGYGRALRYQEVMDCGRGPFAPLVAGGVAVGLAVGERAFALRPARAVLDRLLPAPGTGPSEQDRERGWFRMELSTTTTTGARYEAVVAASGDPGYGATSVMMGQSALCLAFDDLPPRAGVLTPATAMGEALGARLRAQGFEVSVRRTG